MPEMSSRGAGEQHRLEDGTDGSFERKAQEEDAKYQKKGHRARIDDSDKYFSKMAVI